MNILVLTSTYPRWKDDTEPGFVHLLSRNLAGENNTVHVIAPHASGAASEETLDGVEVFRFRYGLPSWQTLAYEGGILPNLREKPLRLLQVPFFLASQWLLAVKLLRKHRYDVIHAHWIIPQGITAILARALCGARPPIVLTSHGGDLFALKGKLLSGLKRWITHHTDALTVVSEAMKGQAVKLELAQAEQVACIPMGVDTRQVFVPPPDNRERNGLLFVGRLVDKKGVAYLLDAMPAILQKHPGERLTIIGDGPLRPALQAQCQQLGIGDSVVFKGALANPGIPPYLQATAIAVFPSIVTGSGDQEGSPVAIMEAQSCECATVVADYPGASDMIDNGVTGLVVPGRDAGALAGAILALLDDPAKRHALGTRGRQEMQANYDWSVISGKFMSVFQKLAPDPAQREQLQDQ